MATLVELRLVSGIARLVLDSGLGVKDRQCFRESLFLTIYGTLKLQNKEPSYKKKWLVHWPLMCGLIPLVQRGGAWAGCGPAQSPPRCTKCISPHINGQCANFIFFDVAL